MDAYQKIQQHNSQLTRPLSKVKDSLQYMNDEIQLLGNVHTRGTTKFLVRGEQDLSIVTVHFPLGKCYIK